MVASLRDHHGHFIRRIKLILRGHMTAVRQRRGGGVGGVGWWGCGCWVLGWWWASPHIILSGYHIDIVHFDGHGLPQMFVETSVLDGLSSLSSGCGQFHRYTVQGIPDTGFHRRRHTICDQVPCFGVDHDGAQGVEKLVDKPRLHGFWKFWPVFRKYLWYRVSPWWCRPGLLWCRTLGVGILKAHSW